MKSLNHTKDEEREALSRDLKAFLASGGKINRMPILYRDDDPLAIRKHRRTEVSGRKASIADIEPYKSEDAVKLHRMGYSRQNIAVRLKVSRTTINRWLDAAVRKK